MTTILAGILSTIQIFIIAFTAGFMVGKWAENKAFAKWLHDPSAGGRYWKKIERSDSE